jgi:hypothetical protein
VQTPWGINNHEVGAGTAIQWKHHPPYHQHHQEQPQHPELSGRDADGSAWLIRHNASGWRRKVYYDDAVSIARKVQMCSEEKGIAGVGVWTVDTLQSLGSSAGAVEGGGDAAVTAAANESSAMWAALWPPQQQQQTQQQQVQAECQPLEGLHQHQPQWHVIAPAEPGLNGTQWPMALNVS